MSKLIRILCFFIMKKRILLLFVLMSFLVLSSCSSTSPVESSGDFIMDLPSGSNTSPVESSGDLIVNLQSGSNTSPVENSDDLIANLPLYEFDVDDIPDYKQDISNYESTIEKFDLLDEHDVLKYGQNIFDKISSNLSINSELDPIAILRDDSHNAWGVSFGRGGVGDGYSIAFFSNGGLIAAWPEE